MSDATGSLSNEQLESILAARCCKREQELLVSSEVHLSTALAKSLNPAVGATLELDVKKEGKTFTVMVDTGRQSSIISRSVVHKVLNT